MKEHLKWLLFPGLNLHARLRNQIMPAHLGRPMNGEERLVLDAGCGNGMLSYQAYLKGNRVVGVSIKDEIVRNRRLFNLFHGIAEDRLSFRDVNLYDIESLGLKFDEIICCEVLEHIRGDEQVCRSFFNILKPGGVLHLCCPNASHPFHAQYPLDADESGGHVRPGYTAASYQGLLEPLGFELSEPVGMGGEIRHVCNEHITRVQKIGGLVLGLPAFAVLAPWSLFDTDSPAVPF
ncbi:MAG: methyltransferase domain-containing protein, partial [Planctomycetaceae bacterium]|nr:methyltransferase domain-containing protein [Planctomycetaceae bacterium]